MSQAEISQIAAAIIGATIAVAVSVIIRMMRTEY